MRTSNRITVMVLLLAASAPLWRSGTARGQVTPPVSRRPDLAIDFTALRSNAPPGGGTSFYGYGGSATLAWPLKLRGVSLLGDVTAVTAPGISSNNYQLTLSAYTVGARYMPVFHRTLLRPFADALVGVAHAAGSLVQGANSSVANAGAAFALNAGGGLDVKLSPHLSLRLAEIDYLMTDFDNGAGNRQNILRMSAGGVLHF